MGKLNPHKTGMGVGAFFAVAHAAWAIVVASGAAYSLLSWVLNLHMMDVPFTVHAFSFGYAIGLVAMTAVVGYVFGFVFSHVWNWATRM